MRKMKRFPVLTTLLTLAVFARLFTAQPLRSQGEDVRVQQRPGMDKEMKMRLDSLLKADSAFIADSLFPEPEWVFYPLDTMRVPDTLARTDSFRYKYFIAFRDSATLAAVRDSLLARGDTLARARLDSIWAVDSAAIAQWKFDKWYWGLSKKERRAYDRDKRLAALNAAKLARLEAREAHNDSVRARRDSILDNTPRILETWVLPDSLLDYLIGI